MYGTGIYLPATKVKNGCCGATTSKVNCPQTGTLQSIDKGCIQCGMCRSPTPAGVICMARA